MKRLLAYLAARRAHRAAMQSVYRGQVESRQRNRNLWYEQYRVKG